MAVSLVLLLLSVGLLIAPSLHHLIRFRGEAIQTLCAPPPFLRTGACYRSPSVSGFRPTSFFPCCSEQPPVSLRAQGEPAKAVCEFFGEGSSAGQPLRLATVTAVTECLVTCIPKTEVVSLLHREPAFSKLFIAHLLARAIRVEEALVDQLFNSSEKRLARTLLLLANFGKEGAPEPVLAKISQETLANMIGTTRARVSFFMTKFRRLGLGDYNGEIKVHRSLLNVVLHEKPEIDSEFGEPRS
ncbi:MAG: family transcriptional regulator, cyclic receptor protein [Hyphomicrobiales bacterium]|jgi:hypothetical protein|nr:family transcriptional regulator, cyclic receptor protein [Hyphomicrobiales bacterium]